MAVLAITLNHTALSLSNFVAYDDTPSLLYKKNHENVDLPLFSVAY